MNIKYIFLGILLSGGLIYLMNQGNSNVSVSVTVIDDGVSVEQINAVNRLVKRKVQ